MTPRVSIGVIEPIAQKTNADCAIAALAMLGHPYRVVSDVARTRAPRPHDLGLWASDIVWIATQLRLPLKKCRAHQWPEDGVGLWMLDGKHAAHVVVAFHGVLIDPADGLVWLPEAFLATRNWRVTSRWLLMEGR